MKIDLVELKTSKQKNYVTVYYDSDLEATVDVWVGSFETKDNFYKGLICVLENIKRYKSEKWLADLSGIEGDFAFIKAYITTYILPEAIRYGLKYEALILPYDIFSMLSVQMTVEEIQNFEIRLFGNEQEAVDWLKTKKIT